MIQFRDHEVYKLLRACKEYQKNTGSEYIWDEYEALITKLKSYQKEITVD